VILRPMVWYFFTSIFFSVISFSGFLRIPPALGSSGMLRQAKMLTETEENPTRVGTSDN